MLTDSFGRKIDYLRLSVTDRCNLRCTYCMPPEGIRLISRKEILSFKEIIKAVTILSEMGIEKIRVTGGEPLARAGIIDLIKNLKQIDNINEISITTNGILLNGYLDELHKIPVKGINISLDTIDEQKYRIITRGGEIKQVLSAVSDSVNIGIKTVKINVVITKLLDEKDIEGFINMTFAMPVHIRFIEMMEPADGFPSPGTIECSSTTIASGRQLDDTGPGLDGYAGDHPSGFKNLKTIFSVMEKTGKYHAINDKMGNGPALYYRFEKAMGSVGFIINDNNFCRYCNRVRLTSYGTVRLCLFSGKEYDIKKKLRDTCSIEEIKNEITEFIKIKPENRETGCIYDRDTEKNNSGFKLKEFMNRIGG